MKILLDEHIPYALARSFPDGWDLRSTIEAESLNLVEYAPDNRYGHFMRPLNLRWIATAHAVGSRVSQVLKHALSGTEKRATCRLHEANDQSR